MGYPGKWSHYPWNSSKNDYRHGISQCGLAGIVAFARRLNLMILEVFSKFIDSTKATRPPAGAPPLGAAGPGAQLLQQRSRVSPRVLRLWGTHTSAFQPQSRAQRCASRSTGTSPQSPRKGLGHSLPGWVRCPGAAPRCQRAVTFPHTCRTRCPGGPVND